MDGVKGWMAWMRRRADVLMRKEDAERELDEELRFHLDMEVRQHVASGLSPREARRRALRDFGGVERFKEEVRDVRGARVVDDLVQDVRVAGRSLPKHPAFLVAVVLTLGIGIGGNVAMFGVLRSSVFAELPWPEGDRLVIGRSTFNDGARLGPMVSAYDFFDYRDRSTALEDVGAIMPFPQRATVTGGDEAERVDVVPVSANFFQALGVDAVVGRAFAADEGEPGAPPVALLSNGYWQRRFAGDPAVVGRTLSLDGVTRTVVGVMPPEARFYVDADVWLPVVRDEGWGNSRSAHNFLVVGRLAPGASIERAQQEADALSAALARSHPDSNTGKGLVYTPARDMLVEGYRDTLRLLVGAVVLLLVVACANVAGLLLSRGQTRTSELAIRSVMGAGTGRLVRQLVTENALLALGAGAVGLVLAVGIQRGILSLLSLDVLGDLSGGISWDAVAIALGLSLGTVLLFGVAPSLRAARTDPARDIRSGARVAGTGGQTLRSALVVAQVAFTVVLLSGAGLLLRSLQELRSVDLGFDDRDLLTAQVQLPREGYEAADRAVFYESLADRLRTLPGVEGVALSTHLPLRDQGDNWEIGVAEDVGADDAATLYAHMRTVLPGYFDVMGIPLLTGRAPEAADAGTRPAPVVLSRSVADRLFPGGQSALGRFVGMRRRGVIQEYEVVGVAGNVVLNQARYGASDAMYLGYHGADGYHGAAPRRMSVAIRHGGDAAAVTAGLRQAVRALDLGVPVDGVESMAAVLRRNSADERALAVLVGVFGAVALLLAAVGLYGVLAYQVAQRMREIGIRIALGASTPSISRGVVSRGMRLVALGLAVGIPAALFSARVIENLLFEVGSADVPTLVGVTVFLALVGTVACLLPAARAARVDPVQAFRAE